MSFLRALVSSFLLASLLALPALAHKQGHDDDSDSGKTVEHVLLISIDGMHALDSKHGQSPVDSPRYTGIAPTILKALGLDPNDLQAVQKEHTQVLPGVPLN